MPSIQAEKPEIKEIFFNGVQYKPNQKDVEEITFLGTRLSKQR